MGQNLDCSQLDCSAIQICGGEQFTPIPIDQELSFQGRPDLQHAAKEGRLYSCLDGKWLYAANGAPQLRGCCRLTSVDLQKQFEGDFKDGLAQGRGKIENKTDGWIFTGNMDRGVANGRGQLQQFAYIIVGDYEKSKLKKGVVWFRSDSQLETHSRDKAIVEDASTKRAHILFSNGDHYFGEIDFSSWYPEGKGEMAYSNGDRYKGQFKEGLSNGHGYYLWKNNTYYEGQYNSGKKEGEGQLCLATKTYIGEFKYGVYHGFGHLKYKDNKQPDKIGLWEHGLFKGVDEKETQESAHAKVADIKNNIQKFDHHFEAIVIPFDINKYQPQNQQFDKSQNQKMHQQPKKSDLAENFSISPRHSRLSGNNHQNFSELIEASKDEESRLLPAPHQ